MCSRWLCGVCISALCVCVCVCVLCVGQFGVGLGNECAAGDFLVFVYRQFVCVCCVWDSLVWVWGSECAAGGFVVFVYWHYVCVCVCVCGTVWLVWVWESECAVGGFKVFCIGIVCV